jgi:hypothetical protein
MLRALKTHPFGVEAFFRRSLVLTYALGGSTRSRAGAVCGAKPKVPTT